MASPASVTPHCQVSSEMSLDESADQPQTSGAARAYSTISYPSRGSVPTGVHALESTSAGKYASPSGSASTQVITSASAQRQRLARRSRRRRPRRSLADRRPARASAASRSLGDEHTGSTAARRLPARLAGDDDRRAARQRAPDRVVRAPAHHQHVPHRQRLELRLLARRAATGCSPSRRSRRCGATAATSVMRQASARAAGSYGDRRLDAGVRVVAGRP